MERTFSQNIIHWYHQHKRALPWRETQNPYYIWLSEIILQQTRVSQGLPYYEKFVEKYPTIYDLAKADEQEVLKLWQGLGYYSRARNLHFTAKKVVDEFDGIFPTTYEQLLKLKGIGDYTAAAISSFCSGESVPVLDGNVFRVLARYFGISSPINEPTSKKEFKNLAIELVDNDNSGIYNQAIMEFGALQCTPVNPNCQDCPLQDSCVALRDKKVSVWPIKTNKIKVKKRYFNYLVFHSLDDKTILEKRTDQDIWKHLYQFPLVESDSEIDVEDFRKLYEKSGHYNSHFSQICLLNPISLKHKLTHQELHIKFWKIEVEKVTAKGINWVDITKFPFPIILNTFIENYLKDV